jgi:hypothetical protein
MAGRAGGRAGDAARDPAAGKRSDPQICWRGACGPAFARPVLGRLRDPALPVLRPVCEELADGPISSRDTQARTEDRAWPEGCAANRNGAPRGVRLSPETRHASPGVVVLGCATRRSIPRLRAKWRFDGLRLPNPGRHRAAGMRAADRNPQRKNPYNARRLREIPPSWTVRFAGAGIDSRRA